MLQTSQANQQVNNKFNELLESIFNLKTLVQSYSHGESVFEFDYFLSQIKQKQSDTDILINLLKQLRHCIHMLDPKRFENSLINLIFFEIKWHLHPFETNVLKYLSEFLIDLNSAYTCYIHKCLTMLVKTFLIANTTTPNKNSNNNSNKNVNNCLKIDESLIDYEVFYTFAHNVIVNLIKIAPVSKTNLVKQIDTLYPYMIKDTLIQEAYIKNVLRIIEYASDLRLSLMEICVQKLLKIDVSCQREQIIEAEMNVDLENNSIEEILPDIESNNKLCMKHPLADRLDVMMLKMFDFIQLSCVVANEANANNLTLSIENKQFDWELCKSVYKDLLFVFDKYILRTYGSSHVQFLMFYICSRRPMVAEGFLDYLWKKFSSPASCQITRQICAYYIGSYLARAKYIALSSCVASLQLIVTWIHNYMEKVTSKNYLSFEIHRTFYALCQTLFYIIIFRNRQLFKEGQNDILDLVKSWKLNQIVSSKLNPLRYCLPTIRKKFARIAYLNQVAYCYTIIDNINRTTLPTTSESFSNSVMFFSNKNLDIVSNKYKNKNSNVCNQNPLDSFFPFDPYLLNRSKKYIESIYQEFQNVLDIDMQLESDDEEDETDDEDKNDDDEESNEDDDDDDDDGVDNNENDTNKKITNANENLNKFMNNNSSESHMEDSDFESSIDTD